MMSHQDREVDDLDYMLRDALRRTNDPVPNPQRVLAQVFLRISAGRQAKWRGRSVATPLGDHAYLTTSYWYLAPLARMVH